MKVKNIAFFGVMASILSVGGAYATDSSTIIASKAYVDANVATKQNKSDRVTTTWSQTSAADKSSTEKYPSMKTMVEAVNAVDVSSQLSGYVPIDQTAANKDKVLVTDENGQVTPVTPGKHIKLENGKLETTYKEGSNIHIANDGTISADQPTVPTKTSDLTNDSDFTTNEALANGLKTKVDIQQVKVPNKIVMTTDESRIEKFVDIDDNTLEFINEGSTLAAKIPGASNFIDNAITDGVTDKAPSEDAVHDALANKVTKNANITGATKTKITYDAKGLVTAGADLEASDIPDISAKYEVVSNKSNSQLITMDQDEKKITEIAAGTDKAYATTEALSKDFSSVKKAIEAVQSDVSGITVNDATLTVQRNGTTLDTFTANSNTNKTINVEAVVGVASVSGTGEAITGVTEDSSHKVAATKSKLTYAGAMNSALPNINGSEQHGCTDQKPCVLSFDGTNYTWTNMDL